MTTKNLNQANIEAVVKAAAKVANEVRSRQEALSKSAKDGDEKAEAKARDLEVAAATVRQRAKDEAAADNEELQQLNEILGNKPKPEPAAPTPTPSPEPALEPKPKPAASAAPEPVEEAQAPEPEPEPEPEPASEAVNPTRIQRVVDVRNWSGLQWVLAFAGLLLALVMFSQWPEWAARNIDGFIGGLVTTLWFIGHAGTGFFGGGWLGWWLRRNEDGDS